MVCGGEVCNDDFHIRHELMNKRDTRFLYLQTHAINTHQMALVMDLPQVMLASKYFCSRQLVLQMELNKHTWLLSIWKETPVKSMDGLWKRQYYMLRP